jgi:hypothetical protein
MVSMRVSPSIPGSIRSTTAASYGVEVAMRRPVSPSVAQWAS